MKGWYTHFRTERVVPGITYKCPWFRFFASPPPPRLKDCRPLAILSDFEQLVLIFTRTMERSTSSTCMQSSELYSKSRLTSYSNDKHVLPSARSRRNRLLAVGLDDPGLPPTARSLLVCSSTRRQSICNPPKFLLLGFWAPGFFHCHMLGAIQCTSGE